MDIGKIVKAYVAIRDEKARVMKEAEAQCAVLAEKLARLEGELHRVMLDSNVDSIRTEAGTAFRKESLKVSCNSWESYDTWLRTADVPFSEAYEKRVSKKFVEGYMGQHDGELPPGIAAYREFVVQVRRGD